MLFKDIKQNYTVYILDKQDMNISQAKVSAVGFPRMDIMQNTPGANAQTVIDITLDSNGKIATYTIPESLSVTYAGNIVLSTDKDGLMHEIEAMKNNAEQVIASVDKQKQILEKANILLSELNPVYKEKKETDLRFSKIENSISEMKDMFANFLNTYRHESNNNTTTSVV